MISLEESTTNKIQSATLKENNQVVLFGDSNIYESRPIGIYVLASFLRQHNVPTQTIWGWNQPTYHIFYGLCKKFLNEHVKIVGISSTLLFKPDDPNNLFGLDKEELYRRFTLIKKLAPNAKIIVGGSQVEFVNLSAIPGSEFIDLFVKGQGEEALLEIVKAVTTNKKITTTSVAPALTSDAVYKYQNFATTPLKFDSADCLVDGEAVAIEFSRGCIFKCSFCSYDLNGKRPGDYIKSKETLREELLYNYYKFGTTYYYASDDLINDSEEKVDMLLEVSKSLPFKLTYSGYLRLDLIRRFPSMAAKLKESGLIACFFGIETINDDSGKAVGKGLGLERTTEALDICHRGWNNEVLGTAGLIMGLPKDTSEYKYQLVDWLNSSRVRNVIKDCSVQPLFITPGLGISDIDKNPEKFGYYSQNETMLEKNRYGLNHMDWKTDCYSLSQAIEDSEFVLNEFYKNLKFKTRIPTFRLPYILSLALNPDKILNTIINDTPADWKNNVEFEKYLHNLTENHRKKYIKLLLTGDK